MKDLFRTLVFICLVGAIVVVTVQILVDNKDARVQVGGHTDAVGTDAYNQKLSQDRAAAVVNWLVAHGIPRERLEVRGYGATIIECEPTLEARESTAARVIAETGGTMVPPYNHPNVIAGQGTIALELLDECPVLRRAHASSVLVGGRAAVPGTLVRATTTGACPRA